MRPNPGRQHRRPDDVSGFFAKCCPMIAAMLVYAAAGFGAVVLAFWAFGPLDALLTWLALMALLGLFLVVRYRRTAAWPPGPERNGHENTKRPA